MPSLSSANASLTILLTEGSSTSARQALYSLGPRHTIDLLDPSPWCQCRFSRFVRRRYRCPPFSEDPLGYLQVLAERLKTGQYDVLLPTHEQIYLLARFPHLLSRFAAVALPEFACLDRLMSKANFVRLLNELNLPQPTATIIRERGELQQVNEFPVYVKLDYSTAGQGVRLVRDRDELLTAIRDFDQAGWLDGGHELVVQQPAAGKKGSITGVFQHGELKAAHCVQARALGVGGSSNGQISNWHPIAREHLQRLGRHLNWHGALVMEYCYDAERQRPEYLECNPRMGETLNGLLSGVDVCQLLVQLSMGGELAVQEPNRPGIRTHQGFLVLMAKAIAGANRRVLVDELRKMWRGTGMYENSHDEMTRPRHDWLSLVPGGWVALAVLAFPATAQMFVSNTVSNYSLTAEAVPRIRQLDEQQVAPLFGMDGR